MTKDSNGSGRMFTMVGIIAVVAIPLAILAPSLSKNFAEKDEQTERLEPVLESEDVRAPGTGMTRASGASMQNGDMPTYGQPSSFGEPTMNPSLPNLPSPEPDNPPPSTPAAAKSAPSPTAAKNGPSSGTRLASPLNRAPKLSKRDIERRGAQMLGLPTTPTRKTVEYREGKAQKPAPRSGPEVTFKAQ